MRKNIFILLIVILLSICSNVILAATITGSIYDLGLDKELDVILEINTIPKQTIISKDGDYTLNVPIGSYTIHAFTETSESSESIVVSDDGEYVIDIILEESISDSDIYSDISDIDVGLGVSSDLPSDNNSFTYRVIILIISAIIVLIILLFVYLFYVRKYSDNKLSKLNSELSKLESTKHLSKSNNSKELDVLDEYETKILSLIRKEKRTTQKDIRKEIPLSESKISLVIADLENKGKIRKIKKGRGNILIFVKN